MAFKPNPNFAQELGAGVNNVLREAAEKSAEEVRNVKHRIMPKSRGRGSVVVREIDGRIVLGNTDRGAHLDEFGSKNNPAYQPLRRGIRAAGYRFKESE